MDLYQAFSETFEGGGWADPPEWEDFDEWAAARWERAARRLAQIQGWRPIASAPKDGTRVLAWDGRSIGIAFWGREGHPANRLAWLGGHCRIDHIDQPTHWIPLPAEPVNET